MQRLLNPSEVARIDARLHDNALLQACRKVWPGRQDEITSVVARSEDIFCVGLMWFLTLVNGIMA